jgi:hypothetical protein
MNDIVRDNRLPERSVPQRSEERFERVKNATKVVAKQNKDCKGSLFKLVMA